MKTRPLPALLGVIVLGAVGASAARVKKRPRERLVSPPANVSQARLLYGSAAGLAASVLADSALEHYRGSFENPGMFAPLITSMMTLGAGAEGVVAGSQEARAFRRTSFRLSVGVGAAGLCFHLYNIFKRPGGFGWLNLFYAAPLGAPAALSTCGLIGLAAERLATQEQGAPRLLGLPAGRALAAFTSLALAGTIAEVGLFHFRGAFQNPFMYAPVTLPPVASALLAAASVEQPAKAHPITRAWLWLTMVLGVIGMGFHVFGVSRAMGGWRNWSQNLLDGPPLPAPPGFSALSLAGLAALSLIEKQADAEDGRIA